MGSVNNLCTPKNGEILIAATQVGWLACRTASGLWLQQLLGLLGPQLCLFN
jgi:hypothetical protein